MPTDRERPDIRTLDSRVVYQDSQQWVTRDRFEAMVRDGVITDDSTLAAYALLLLHEKQPTARPV